jgi:hypothetical protein
MFKEWNLSDFRTVNVLIHLKEQDSSDALSCAGKISLSYRGTELI